MKLSIPRNELKLALQGMGKVLPRAAATSMPILRALRFEMGTDGVTVTATNLDEHLAYRFENAVVCQTGKPFIVNVDRLKPLTSGAARDVVEFASAAKGQLAIVNPVGSQSVRQTVATLDTGEWPNTTIEVQTKPVDGPFLA